MASAQGSGVLCVSSDARVIYGSYYLDLRFHLAALRRRLQGYRGALQKAQACENEDENAQCMYQCPACLETDDWVQKIQQLRADVAACEAEITETQKLFQWHAGTVWVESATALVPQDWKPSPWPDVYCLLAHYQILAQRQMNNPQTCQRDQEYLLYILEEPGSSVPPYALRYFC